MKIILIIILVAIVLIGILIISYIFNFNKLQEMNIKINETAFFLRFFLNRYGISEAITMYIPLFLNRITSKLNKNNKYVFFLELSK